MRRLSNGTDSLSRKALTHLDGDIVDGRMVSDVRDVDPKRKFFVEFASSLFCHAITQPSTTSRKININYGVFLKFEVT